MKSRLIKITKYMYKRQDKCVKTKKEEER